MNFEYMMRLALEGFILGMGLIAAIGPQNAFVLQNGIRKRFVLITPLVTSLCDTILILLGVFGCGQALSHHTASKLILMTLGAIFLSVYSIKCLIGLFKTETLQVAEKHATDDLRKVLLYAVSLSFLNPHAILDTIIIVGSVTSNYTPYEAIAFTVGLVAASFTWFFSISLFASRFSSYLANPMVWKAIGLSTSIICLCITYVLVNDIMLIIY